ncbi:MAG: insulinase family protein [Oscillospiraceae bacterium]|jgi:predicted Zn-dependent peptidase|nr:insulinase family protein [Oscillospiraceae bacterium]
MIHTIRNLSPRTRLTHIGTDMFKSAYASVTLVRQASEGDSPAAALLGRVLRRGTTAFPDMSAISGALDELYGGILSDGYAHPGDAVTTGAGISFIDGDVAGDATQTDRAFELLGSLLLSPVTEGGVFAREYVESEKNLLIQSARAVTLNKPLYATTRLYEHMFGNDVFVTPLERTEEILAEMNPKKLYAFYRKTLEESRIEIVYCGNADLETVELAVGAYLAPLLGNIKIPEPYTKIDLAPPHGEPREFSETAQANQSTLVAGFRLGEPMLRPNYAAYAVFNYLLGGSPSSKLFANVREKQSLAYSVGSDYNAMKGFMTISAGIDADKKDGALAAFYGELGAMKNGEFTDAELASAKSRLVSSVLSSLESADGVAARFFVQHTYGLSYTPLESAALLELVTRDDVTEAAAGIVPDTVFFLEGKETEV